MIIEQQLWTEAEGWRRITPPKQDGVAPGRYGLVLAFGDRDVLADTSHYETLRHLYPNAHIVSCSTAGEIIGGEVHDGAIAATAIAFHKATFHVSALNFAAGDDSRAAGRRLASSIPSDGLVHLFVISDGQRVNGSELVRGISDALPPQTTITGGLAGDGTRFQQTLVGLDGPASEGNIVAIGLYGESLRIGYGSIGGWDSFGPERNVTRSEGNVLYELDGQSAQELYKQYLGDLVEELPGSALLFPLSIRTSEQEVPVVRTILSIDNENESMTFAGDMPQGAQARLMKANVDRLIEGASRAAYEGYERIGSVEPELALLVSCVGRKVVLGQRTEEEIEAVRDVLGSGAVVAGFYSYGEISPFSNSFRCELHNQTMTITTISERADV